MFFYCYDSRVPIVLEPYRRGAVDWLKKLVGWINGAVPVVKVGVPNWDSEVN